MILPMSPSPTVQAPPGLPARTFFGIGGDCRTLPTLPERRQLSCLTVWIISELRGETLAVHLALVADHSDHATRLHCVDVETLFDGPLTPTEEGAANGQTVLDLAG